MVRKARDLKKTKGILAEPDKKLGQPTLDELKNSIQTFYESDKYSMMYLGKKEFVSVKIDGEKQHAKDTVNLKELYIDYVRVTGNKVSFSKFSQLRPKWCITVNHSSSVHSVCLHKIH